MKSYLQETDHFWGVAQREGLKVRVEEILGGKIWHINSYTKQNNP